MLMANSGSPGTGWMSVALPPSPTSRQTNPGMPSARALMRSRLFLKSAIIGSSTGALSRPTLISARWNPLIRRPSLSRPRLQPLEIGEELLVARLAAIGAAGGRDPVVRALDHDRRVRR